MTTIWKFPLPGTRPEILSAPIGTKFFHAGPDPTGVSCVWGKVNPDEETTEWQIYVIGTGSEVPDVVPLQYLESKIDGPFIWHIFIGAKS